MQRDEEPQVGGMESFLLSRFEDIAKLATWVEQRWIAWAPLVALAAWRAVFGPTMLLNDNFWRDLTGLLFVAGPLVIGLIVMASARSEPLSLGIWATVLLIIIWEAMNLFQISGAPGIAARGVDGWLATPLSMPMLGALVLVAVFFGREQLLYALFLAALSLTLLRIPFDAFRLLPYAAYSGNADLFLTWSSFGLLIVLGVGVAAFSEQSPRAKWFGILLFLGVAMAERLLESALMQWQVYGTAWVILGTPASTLEVDQLSLLRMGLSDIGGMLAIQAIVLGSSVLLFRLGRPRDSTGNFTGPGV